MFVKIVIFLMLIFAPGCGSSGDDSGITYDLEADGLIKRQGFTTYMYGTHVLKDDNEKTLYALKSDNIKLDVFVDLYVTVKGDLISGYPVDGGPDYLNVKAIE